MAREMSTFDPDSFLDSVGMIDGGLLHAVKARKYDLSRFIIHFMRNRSHRFNNEEKLYLNIIIRDLICANYWDLLQILYEMNENLVNFIHVLTIARLGHIEGLRALSSCQG